MGDSDGLRKRLPSVRGNHSHELVAACGSELACSSKSARMPPAASSTRAVKHKPPLRTPCAERTKLLLCSILGGQLLQNRERQDFMRCGR